MEINVETLLDKVSEHVKSLASTETILGEEFTLGEYTCRPVIRVGTGFGSGSGSGTGENPKSDKSSKAGGTGVGAGAGIGVTPVGFLVARGDQISFVPSDKKSGLSTLLEKVPDLVEKVADMKSKEKKEEEKEDNKKEKKS